MSALLNNKLRNARELLQHGDVAAAAALCDDILARAPRNPEALTLRGIAALMTGDAAAAARDLRQSLAAAPGDGATLDHLGLALLNLGSFAEAEDALRRAAQLPGAPASVWLRLGLAVMHQGRAAAAVPHLRKALQLAPGHPDCLSALGRALAAAGDRAGAITQFEALLRAAPRHADALFNLGVLELDGGDPAVAAEHFRLALAADPAHADAMVNLSIVHERANDHTAAVALLERAVLATPAHPQAHGNLGRLRLAAGETAAARHHFEQALSMLPGLPAAIEGMGAVARQQGRHGEAIHWFSRLVELDAQDAQAWARLADSRLQVGRLDEARDAASRAQSLQPGLPLPYAVLGQILIVQGRLDEAIAVLEQGYAHSSNAALLGLLVHQARHACDWERWRRHWPQLRSAIDAGEDCGSPFALLCEDSSAGQQAGYTRSWAQRRFGVSAPRVPATAQGTEKLRIGYLSSDFQEHPAAYLVTEMLELHDRGRFEILAYSYGPESSGAMRRRIVAAVDRFIDIAWETDDAAVARIREDRIDILIDLKGYTVGDRLGIMAQRPSPVQVTWLGYPGTTGTDFIDYLIADPQIIGPGEDHWCTERVLRMPHCYQPIDRKRPVAESLRREQYGLPAEGTVLCCFNQTFKITPDVLAVWLRVLQALPQSVLWLVDGNPWASGHLRDAAVAAGIDAGRLVFAPRVPLAEHLARYRVADLALDTFPYTSHTTASDALWCGCPLVALCGDTFAARVSASILAACGLPDLVTRNLAAYESRILELAGTPAALAAVKARLDRARTQSPLFDTAAFTRDFENLLLQMHAAAGP